MGQLIQIVHKHEEDMISRDELVEKMLEQYPPNVLKMFRAAKDASLKTERKLLKSMSSESRMKQFLKDIIKTETEFNKVYEPLKQQQKEERAKIESNISKYERKEKCLNQDVSSLGDLIFAQSIYIRSLQDFMESVINECHIKGIVIYNHGVNMKKIERSFYKCFYVYNMKTGHKQITDILRASIVFQSFRDLYGAFNIISKQAGQNKEVGPILRVKDRFNPETVPFGYRDLLINIHVPGSKIVGEIQLHHKMFYDRKHESHAIYKKARLFQDLDTGTNIAYEMAAKRYKMEFKDENDEKMKGVDSIEKLAQTFDDEKELCILIDKASDCERYDDMRTLCKRLAAIKKKLKQDFDDDQRDSLSVAYKNCTGRLRAALEEDIGNVYYENILLNELENVCDEVFTILTDLAKIVKDKNDADSECFYLKMAGDYSRYMVEFQPSPDLPYMGAARECYEKAIAVSKNDGVQIYSRLCAVLNYTVFLEAHAKETESAIKTAQRAIDYEKFKNNKLGENEQIIVDLLKENIELWESNNGD